MKTDRPRVKDIMKLSVISMAIAVSFFQYVSAQDDSDKLILQHADHLNLLSGVSDVFKLDGNVQFSQGDLNLFSDHATWYRKTGLVRFEGSVTAIDNEKTINANRITYFSRDKRVIAQGDVCIEDTRENIELACGKADYFRRSREFYAYEDPVLILNPYDDSARVEISAKRLEYSAKDSSGMAHDSVIIIRSNLTVTGGEAVFSRNPESVTIFNDPLVIEGDNRLTGDTISIFTHNKNIERLIAKGDAKAIYKIQPDSSYDEFTTAEMTGKELEVFFKDDQVDKAVMRRNAISVYIPAVTDTLTKGTNVASGDSITLYFDDGAIQRVYISGGAEGKYIEQIISEEDEPKFDTTIYVASVIDYDFRDSEISLIDNGSLEYEDMFLRAGNIRYNLNEKILTAEGLRDDSTDEITQLPIIIQGTEQLDGQRMKYNLETEKGQVTQAKTIFENSYYKSEKIRQISDDEMFVSQADFTSCDKEEGTHYHFHSNRMKMIGRDKVVAKPVIMYIGEVPVFAIPYYVFPVRKGRHSGFLPFRIGNFERGDRFIENVGYYWAASDYWDLETSLDFYENVKLILNNRVRYKILYVLSGNVGVNFARETAWADFKRRIRRRWRLNVSHNQTISPSVKILASGTFVSDKNYIADNIYDPDERLNRTVRSNASLTKRWKSSSLVVQADQTWNLDTDARRDLLPSIRFSRSSLPLFPDPTTSKKKVRTKPWEEIEPPSKRFYHNFYFSFNTSGQNFSERKILTDSTHYWRNFQTVHSTANVRIKSPKKFFGILSIEPSTNLSHTIYHLEWNRVVENLGLETSRLFTRETYNLSVTAKTDLYGTVSPNIFGLTGLRHVMTPSIGYRFTPEIENNEEYRGYTGVGTSSRRSKSMTYSLSNLFQSKYLSDESEKKLDLFTLSLGGSYNFAEEVRKLSDLSVSARTSALPKLSVDYSSTYSFYNFDDTRRPLTNLRLKTVIISSSINGGYGLEGSEGGGRLGGFRQRNQARSPFEDNFADESDFSNAGFNFSISHRYSISKLETQTTKTQWLNFSLNIQPTSKWNMAYENRYNIKDKNIASQSLRITRNLHCWDGSFVWIPTGPIAGYYVKIYIKSLPDIKVEKSEGGVRGRYY